MPLTCPFVLRRVAEKSPRLTGPAPQTRPTPIVRSCRIGRDGRLCPNGSCTRSRYGRCTAVAALAAAERPTGRAATPPMLSDPPAPMAAHRVPALPAAEVAADQVPAAGGAVAGRSAGASGRAPCRLPLLSTQLQACGWAGTRPMAASTRSGALPEHTHRVGTSRQEQSSSSAGQARAPPAFTRLDGPTHRRSEWTPSRASGPATPSPGSWAATVGLVGGGPGPVAVALTWVVELGSDAEEVTAQPTRPPTFRHDVTLRGRVVASRVLPGGR
jgi:hypothetical protein